MKYTRVRTKSKVPKYFDGGSTAQEQDTAKGDAAYNAIYNVPVIGGFTKVGDSIGKPIKNSVEKTNDDGTLKNRNASTLGHTAGALFNPYSTLTRTLSDRSASGGQKTAAVLTGGISDVFFAKKYNNKVEDQAKVEIEKQNAIQAEEDARLKAEQDAIAEEERIKQDGINQNYANIHGLKGDNGSIYAGGGKLPKSNKMQYGSYSKASKKELDNAWRSNGYSNDYEVYQDSTKVGNKSYYNYYFSDKSKDIPKSEIDKNLTVKSNILDPVKQIGYNGMLAPIVEEYAGGGKLPLASDTYKAIGPSHEEGGIDLKNSQGKTYAEIEGEEVVKGDNVYSDRIKLPNGNTIAEEAENLGKIKGKSESKLASTNFRERNSSKRMTELADKDLDNLFQLQEMSKIPNSKTRKFPWGGTTSQEDDDLSQGFKDQLGNKNEYDNIMANYNMYSASDQAALPSSNPEPNPSGAKSGFDWSSAGNYASMAVPFIDNVYNASQIKKTPEVPEYTKKVNYSINPARLKTDYNINASLSQNNDSYRNYINDLNQNTNSSQIARGNKMSAFSSLIKGNNDLYQNKANIETQLANQSNMNIQNVSAENIRNKQNIDNLNLSQKDKENFAKYDRKLNIMNAKMANVANATEDGMMLIRDQRNNKLDKDRMKYDDARYTKEEQDAINRRKAKNKIKKN